MSSKSYKQKKRSKKIIFCRRLEGHLRKEQDLELDPDPRIRNRTKMSRIRDTDQLILSSFAIMWDPGLAVVFLTSVVDPDPDPDPY